MNRNNVNSLSQSLIVSCPSSYLLVSIPIADRTSSHCTVNLVNKDQLEILCSLRASVSVEKDAISTELDKVKGSLKLAEDRAKAHREEVNKLLMEKIELQGEGINQREKMLEREREFG